MAIGSWPYRYLAEAIVERNALVPTEKVALMNAEAKLAAFGPKLPHPHSSAVRGADRLRELRPRSGRSPWRALYRQVGDEFVVAAVGPEALVDLRGFTSACRRAERRLADYERQQQ
ncbi:MAG: type II toxin-antitoxin system RelE/ParE family toxin [Acidimicrobiales bacterium]